MKIVIEGPVGKPKLDLARLVSGALSKVGVKVRIKYRGDDVGGGIQTVNIQRVPRKIEIHIV